MTLLTMPWGNFPLNDDWNYGRSVKALIDEHRLLITHWSLAASLTHIMLGWVPSVLFGFSFDALRSVSIIGGLVATICTYLACLRLGADRLTRLFASLTLMVNPIFFNLSMTYMTDVPFLMLAGLSVLLYAKTFSDKRLTWRLIGINCALAVFTCLSRQTGIVLPIGFLLAVATAGHAWGERNRLFASLKAALPALAGIAATSGFQIWLSNTVGTLHSYRVERAWIEQLLQKGPTYVAEHCAMNFIVICIYLGTFLFPLMIMLYPRFVAALNGKERKFALIMFGEPLILLGLGLVLTHSKMPLGDNILFDLGLGPLLLGGQQPLEAWGKGPEIFWVLVTVCGVAGASAMISILVIVLSRLIGKRAFTRFDADATNTAMLLFTSLIYIALIAFRGFFDRYLLFPLLLLLPVFWCWLPERQLRTPRPLLKRFRLHRQLSARSRPLQRSHFSFTAALQSPARTTISNGTAPAGARRMIWWMLNRYRRWTSTVGSNLTAGGGTTRNSVRR
jgi:hypothetical protein